MDGGLTPWIRVGFNSFLFSAFFSGHESGKKLLFAVTFSLCSFGPVTSRFHVVKAPSCPRRVLPSFLPSPRVSALSLLMPDSTGTSPVKILRERKMTVKRE